MSTQVNEFSINLPMTSVGMVGSPALAPEPAPAVDCTANTCLPADVDSSQHSHIYVYVEGCPQVNSMPDISMISMDLVLNVCVTNPTTGTSSTYKVVKRLSMDKCKLACEAELGTPFQVVEGEGEPEDPTLVEAEMKAFYYAREVRRKAGIQESAGTKTAKVLISFDDESEAAKKANPDAAHRGSATLMIKAVKDKAHARHVFDVKHKDKYKNAKITRVTMVEGEQ